MFTYIKLKNFKSFANVTIDFQSKKNSAKNLSIIFGSNGSGKSTIVQAFFTLHRTLGTMRIKDLIMELIENKMVESENIPIKPEKMMEILKYRLSGNTIEKIVEDTKMIDSSEEMVMEFGFIINGNVGKYLMEFNDYEIVHERLEYKIKKNKGCCYDITPENITINSNIFNSEEYIFEMKKQLEMYWGKHTLMSILQNELEEKAGTYVNANISHNLMDVLLELGSISFKVNNSYNDGNSFLDVNSEILDSLDGGVIETENIDKLRKIEKILNEIITALFDDVNKAYYVTNESKGKIKYRLFINKRIGNHSFEIDFKYESSGTQEIIDLLPYLMLAISGKCVIIDEYGNGIHDLLSAKIMNEISDNIKGQLILTSHNTMLMEQEKIPPEALYFIINNKTLNKSVKCVSEIEDRIHPNYNYRNRYFTQMAYEDALPFLFKNVNFTKLAELYH